MSTALKAGHDVATGRDLYVLSVDDVDGVPNFDLGSPHFGVLLLWDSEGQPVEELLQVARKLIALGGVYFCCWGSGCERLHDTIDRAAQEIETPPNSVLMTTWHDDEELQEVLWFFLNTALPHDAFESTTKSMIAISVGNSNWSRECHEAFRDSAAFTERTLNEEKPAV